MTTVRQTPGFSTDFATLVALVQHEESAGRLAEAAAAYRKILAIRPGIAEVHNNLGSVLKDLGKLDEAVTHYERAVALKPGLFQAHNNLGNVLRQQGKLDQAVARYQQTLALRPDLAEACNNLGNVLVDQGKLEEAVIQYERAVALRPDRYQAHHDLGCIFEEQGQLDQAVARYEQALALRPDLAETHNNLGNVLKQQGKFQQAAARYEQALALKPDYAEAHYGLADLKTFRPGDAKLAALQALAAGASHLPPGKLAYIHFALGKAFEDTGDHRLAFEHWLRGNALKRREVDYSAVAHVNTFRLIAKLFDAGLFDRFQGTGDPSPAPIFVLGMPRSGSTLVEQILASHPLVHAAGELKNLDGVVKTAVDSAGQPVPFPNCITVLGPGDFQRLGQAYLASLPAAGDGKLRITDKSPGNFFHVGLIRLILPNARIIHTTRNPVDTCLSCFSKVFTGLPFSYDLTELGSYYRWYYELMSHWRSVLPAGGMLDVAYEDVVDDLAGQARRLIEYCGLPWDDRCLNFHDSNRRIATPSNVQVRQPLYRNSLQRWRRYEAYLGPLLAELEGCGRRQ